MLYFEKVHVYSKCKKANRLCHHQRPTTPRPVRHSGPTATPIHAVKKESLPNKKFASAIVIQDVFIKKDKN